MNASPGGFEAQLALLRIGDELAVEAFVRQHDPLIRRTYHKWARGSSLKLPEDANDLCQFVIFGFLLRLSEGSYVLQSENDVQRLLHSIARRTLLMLARRELAAKRSRFRTISLDSHPEPACHRTSAAQLYTEGQEILQTALSRLTPCERDLFNRRQRGEAWTQIARDLAGREAALRKKLSRALRRIAAGMSDEV